MLFIVLQYTFTHSFMFRYEQVIVRCWRNSATSRPTVSAILSQIETLFLRGTPGDGYYYMNIGAVQNPGYDNNE